ncbi:MAG: leucine-rich repeat protein [Verrucomicrobia bacterium]|nr:leucine-rich repeat protein [Verrucomicrobiota bacterium]
MLKRELEEICKAEGWWSRISNPKIKWKRLCNELGYLTMEMLVKPEIWETLPHEDYFKGKKDFSLKNLIPAKGECWVLFAHTSGAVKEESPIREDGFMLPLQWRSGEEVKKHDKRLPKALRDLADRIKEQFQRDYESQQEKLSLKRKPEEFYLYFSSAVFDLGKEVPIFSEEARDGKEELKAESAWGALATGLYYAMRDERVELWPFSSIRYNFEEGEIERVGHIKEKLKVAASYEGAGFYVATKEQQKAAKKKLKELQTETTEKIRKLEEEKKNRGDEERERLQKQIIFLEKTAKSYKGIEILCPGVSSEEKPLLIVADIADSYAKIRRRKKCKLYVGLTQMLLLLFVLGIGLDQTQIQIYPEYYADYVERWGKPEGILPLTKEQSRHRHAHYRFEYSGRETYYLFGKKVLRRVVYENAQGIPIEHDLYDKRERPSILEIGYLENNKLVHSVKVLDSLEIPVMTYSIIRNGTKSETVEITRHEMLDWAHTYTPSTSVEFFPYKEYFSGIESYKVQRDENGFVLAMIAQSKNTTQKRYPEYSDVYEYSHLYQSKYGKIGGFTYDHDPIGRITRISCLDEEGKYLVLAGGTVGKRYNYDGDKLISVEYIDANGTNLRNNEYGCSKIEYKYNEDNADLYEIAFFRDAGEAPYKKIEIVYEGSNPKKLGDIEYFYDSDGRIIKIKDTDSASCNVEKKYERGYLKKEIHGDEKVIFRRYLEKKRQLIEFYCQSKSISRYANGILRQYDRKGNIEENVREFVCFIDDMEGIMKADESEIDTYLSFKNISKTIKQSSIVQDSIGYVIKYDQDERKNIVEVVSVDISEGEVRIPEKITVDNVSYEVKAIDSLLLKNEEFFIETIIIPSWIKSIDPLGMQMGNVGEIIVEDGNPNYSSLNGVLFDKDKQTLILCPRGQKKKVVIPASVKRIEHGALEECKNLDIEVENGNTEYECADGILIKKRVMELIYIPKGVKGDIHIPEGVKCIGMYAFVECGNLISVTIPESVSAIKRFAFSCCKKLERVVIPDSVTEIGDSAFADCDKLQNITIPDSVTFIGARCFSACIKLQNITIPDKVTEIGDCTFKHCSGLTNVVIGKNVTSIASSAFECCVALGSITLPDSVTSIGDSAFFISGLKNITIPSGVTFIGDYAFTDCALMTNVTILGNITKIGDFTFGDCRRLESMTLPDSITEIGESSFLNCRSMKNITIGRNVTKIKEEAFVNCRGLESITIPDTVAEIGRSVFLGCSSLKEILVVPDNLNYRSVDGVLFNKDKTVLVQYPEGKGEDTYTIAASVKKIGDFAFADCGKLETILIPDNVTEIGENAFLNCKGLKYITIGRGVTKIKERAFVGCSGLTSITIPDNVREMGGSLFWGCSSLASIDIPENVIFTDGGNNAQISETAVIRPGRNYTIPLSKPVELDMVWIEPGTFLMGSPESEMGHRDDETLHRVTLTKGYWIGRYEVTQAQYESLMGVNPSMIKGLDHPVELVTWKDASAFCAKLTETEREAGRLPDGYEYNLPTEAQWEYACRAGTTSSLNSGKEITSLYGICDNVNEVGWYGQNSKKRSHPVGRKKPNAWGLYDTIGNVCELCRDSRVVYTTDPMTDPVGSTEPDGEKQLKGEGYRSDAKYCRAATRNFVHSISYCDPFVGFRVALVPVK